MISLLIGFFAPKIGEKYARFAAWATIIVVAIALFFGLKAIYDHAIVSNHDAKIEASQAKADRQADQNAAAAMTQDEARRGYEDDQLTEATAHAKPSPGVDEATARRIAFHKCLSLQQRARENGLQPPRCV